MSHQRIKAFVLQAKAFGQKDRLLHLLTEKQGLIVAMAYGAASGKSQLQAVTMPFVLGEYEIFAYRERTTIDRGELIEPFLPISQDIDKLTSAAHLSEVTLDALYQGVSENNVYKLWGYSLYKLCSGADPMLTAQIAALRLLSDLGYAPWLNDCVLCHEDIDEGAYFSFRDSGLICPRHREENSICLSYAAISALLYIVQAEYAMLFNFTVSERVRSELLTFIERYLEEKMEKSYSRLKLLESLDNILEKKLCPDREADAESKEKDAAADSETMITDEAQE